MITSGNASVKSYLCSFPGFVDIMVHQLECNWENLRKATAHLFRNLAWKADKVSKSILSESQVVNVLMMAAMSTAARSLVDTPCGLSVEPSKDEESSLKVSRTETRPECPIVAKDWLFLVFNDVIKMF